ncbi:MAG: glycoside hydrolase family 19 protein [Pseudolabrys sp.]
MRRAVDVVRDIAPNARAEYIAALDAGDGQLDEAGVTTSLRLAHLLAQCGGECSFRDVRESLFYTTLDNLLRIFRNMRLDPPLFPGEAEMLLRQERDLGERFYGQPFQSPLYAAHRINGGVNPGNREKARRLGNDRPGDGFLFRGNGMLQTTGGKAHREIGIKCHVDFFNHPELLTAPEHALKPVLSEWTDTGCNAFADADDLLKISRAINFGNPNAPGTPNGMDNRRMWLDRAKQALGISGAVA